MSLWEPEQPRSSKTKRPDDQPTSFFAPTQSPPQSPLQPPPQQYTDYGTPVDAPVHDPYTPPVPFPPLPDSSASSASSAWQRQDEVAHARRNGLWVLGGLFVLFLVVSLMRFSPDSATTAATATPRSTLVPSDIQSSTVLRLDQTVMGTLGAGRTHRYTFNGQAGERVTLRLDAASGSGLDPVLTLLNIDNTTIAEDDDSGDGLNSLVCNVELPTIGVYRADVRGYDSNDTGSYRLSLERGTPIPPLNRRANGTLTSAGNFPGCGDVQYTFEAAAGDIIHVVLEGGRETQPEMTLTDASGNSTTVDTPVNAGSNLATLLSTLMPTLAPNRLSALITPSPVIRTDAPRLELTTVPVRRAQTYTLVARDQNDSTGSFALEITFERAERATSADTPDATPEVIESP